MQFKPVKAAATPRLHQRASHFAIVGVAAALAVTNGVVKSARSDLTGASSHATRLTGRAGTGRGKPLSSDTVQAWRRAQRAMTVGDLNSDLHAAKSYRRAMIPVFTKRALLRAMERSK